MQIVLKDEIFEALKEVCLQYAKETEQGEIVELMEKMMDVEGVPMHYPYHHFIVPAGLLTLAAMEDHRIDDLDEMLTVAIARGKMVPGGACGNLGSCGSGVGAGIFMSIYTDSSPHSEETWQWTNEITAIALLNISKVPGPRCCKRTMFLSLEASLPYIQEKLGIKIPIRENISCKYYERNPDCKGIECPYFQQ